MQVPLDDQSRYSVGLLILVLSTLLLISLLCPDRRWTALTREKILEGTHTQPYHACLFLEPVETMAGAQLEAATPVCAWSWAKTFRTTANYRLTDAEWKPKVFFEQGLQRALP